jgi:hypothetical protein
MELAIAWELGASSARGLPLDVERVLDSHPATRGASLLFGIPEHRVSLPGGSRASQTDLWAVMKTGQDWVSMAVEGKAGEAFGPTVSDWFSEPSEGKKVRLAALCDLLGMELASASPLRYQLLHRTGSALLEAERIGARVAVVLIHNFRADTTCWPDFERFVTQLGETPTRGGLCEVRRQKEPRLLFGWVDSPVATDEQITSAG